MAKPTYQLVDVQQEIKKQGIKAFSRSALDTASEKLNMSPMEAIAFICSQTSLTCYKTMESQKVPGVWMDVYRWPCPNGTQVAYVKLSLDPRSKIVISCKEK